MNGDSPEPGVDERLDLAARICADMGSSLYGTLLHDAAEDYRASGPVRAFFDEDPRRGLRSTIGVRLMGAVHYRALEGTAPELAAHFPSCGGDGDAAAAWRAMRARVARDAERLARAFDATPQTNEVARSMPLLAGLLAIAARTQLPIRLLELGASAALNARLDRYRYEGDGWTWGDPDSPLVLRNATQRGTPAALDAPLAIAERAGCDLHPLDIARPSHRLRLKSYVWADQTERFARLERAIEAAAAVPFCADRAEMLAWLQANGAPRDGVTTVVMHSLVAEHLAADDEARLRTAIEELAAQATASAPFAWLHMEFARPHYETRVALWPARDDLLLACSDGHAQRIVWTGAS